MGNFLGEVLHLYITAFLQNNNYLRAGLLNVFMKSKNFTDLRLALKNKLLAKTAIHEDTCVHELRVVIFASGKDDLSVEVLKDCMMPNAREDPRFFPLKLHCIWSR
ncbi:hypothetical protein FDUTEX481_07189 [Tolypothrix sp. PCC 7601]|nr:hypothetical protein FDUTEX481_07189 [Tolypothrix sp. PCC 7601]